MPFRFRLFCGAVAALISFAVAPATVPAAQAGDSAAYAADFERLLAFIGGSPLTPAEQQRVAERTAADLRADGAGVRKADDQTRAFLDKIAKDPPYAVAEKRAACRLSVELLPENDPTRRIVEAHDPTVAFDPAQKHLITERSLREIASAYAWVSKMLDTPGPDSHFARDERSFLRAQFVSLPGARQEAVAEVGRNYPIAVEVLERADKSKLDAWVTESRPIALKLDPQQRILRMADMLSQTYHTALDELLVQNSLMLGSAANYDMLYHRGYTSGIYR
jgi:hypothetical protein